VLPAASTGSGDARLDEVAAGDVKISTGSGNAEAREVPSGLKVKKETLAFLLKARQKPHGNWTLPRVASLHACRLRRGLTCIPGRRLAAFTPVEKSQWWTL